MSKIDERFEKMQDSINNLQKQFLILKNIETPAENEGVYKISMATEFYHKTNSDKKFINMLSIGFPLYKYFIDEIEQRSRNLNTQLNKKLEEDILNLIGTTFKNEDYVVVITNNSLQHFASLAKLIYEKINKNKVGKVFISEREKGLDEEFKLQSLHDVDENTIVAYLKHSYLNVLSYNGYSLEDQNVILLNDEFGCYDALTNVIIELKPKKMLNFLFARKNVWFDNLD